MDKIVLILFWVIFPVICLIGLGKRKEEKENILTKEDSRYIKGIAACGVVLAHCYYYLLECRYPNIVYLKPFSFLGGMGVLLFFFVSGYGMYKSYEASGNIISTLYWKKRIQKVYIPTVVINLMCFFVVYIIREDFSFKGAIFDVLFSAWYIDVSMLQYLFFYISIKFFNKNRKMLFFSMLVFNTILFLIFSAFKFNVRWRNGLFLFTFGMFIACFEKKIAKIIRENFGIGFVSVVILFLAFGIPFVIGKGTIIADIMKNISGCFLSLVLIFLCCKFRFKNYVIEWIGKNSLYVYLIHIGIINILQSYTKRNSVNSIGAIFLIILGTGILVLLVNSRKVYDKRRKVYN